MSQLPATPSMPARAFMELVRSFPPAAHALLLSLTPNGEVPEELNLSDNLRADLTLAAASLETLLVTPGDVRGAEAEKTKAITFMLAGFPSYGIAPVAADAALRGYLHVVAPYGAWAVVEACDRWLKGQCVGSGDGGSAPTPPQLRRAVEEVLQIVRGKALTLRQLGGARQERTPTEEERARVAALLNWKRIDGAMVSASKDYAAARQNDAQDDRGGNGAPSSGNSDEKG